MITLSQYDPADPPYRPGDRVRLRPATDWGSADPQPRPLHCVYREAGGPQVGIAWTGDLDALAGSELVLEASGRTGLPAVRAAGGLLLLHPDWLAWAGEPACRCDALGLANSGHESGCGWLAWRRAGCGRPAPLNTKK
jgi:hypothetical protein